MRITAFASVARRSAIDAELSALFYGASSTQLFASEAERHAFRQRWLGRYLTDNINECFLLLNDADHVAGYIVGDLRDPAHDSRYHDLPYFQAFAGHTRLYPAHLHVNIAPQHRSAGLGSALLDVFAAHARSCGAPGLHVVTGKGMRNVGFYLRNGFAPIAETTWNDRTIVMLVRSLA